MPYKDRVKRNEYSKLYMRKLAAEKKAERQKKEPEENNDTTK